jgi:hypothetical protein
MTMMQRYANESHSPSFDGPYDHEQLPAGGMHPVSPWGSDASCSGRGEPGQSVTTPGGPAEAGDLCPMSPAPLTPPDSRHPQLDEGSRAKTRHAYANARDVLPSELLALVQRCYVGLVYIPTPSCKRRRNEQICELRNRGLSVEEIAKAAGLSTRRVWQILKERAAVKCSSD